MMKSKTFYKKYENILLTSLAVVIFAVFIYTKYDLIYELNDDTVIRNLLSGTYTGIPTAMNNQMMFALSAVISGLYKIIPAIQWFDIFLIICQYSCVWIVLKRMMEYCKITSEKIILVIVYLAFLFTFFLNHFVLLTYTVTSGILAVTAIFLFITEKNNENLLIKSIPSIVCAVLAFCIRSELLLMLFPFICVAGVYRWSREEKIFTTDNLKKYLGVFGVLIVLIAVVFITDTMAYSSEEWKDFRSFFDARTTVYDYTDIPLYKDNEEFYVKEDITYEQFLLLRSYNFGIDEEIDSKVMNLIADYAEKTGVDLKEKINIALGAYRIQITDKIGTSYHTLVLFGYIILLLSINRDNKFKIIITGIFIFFIRSIIWLYLWGQGRVISRITHPLYWGEFVLLLAIYFYEYKQHGNNEKIKNYIVLCCVMTICFIGFDKEIESFNRAYNREIEETQLHEYVQKYCLENNDNFYFASTYSIGVFPEKVFDGCSEPSNLEILGGWITKSPSHVEKMHLFGINSIDEALLEKDNVYIIQHNDYVSYDTEYPFQWLTSYYKGKGYNVEVIKTDVIVDNIEVYKVEKVN